MSTNYSPKIVTDGLVLCLDAGNGKSFVSGSTTWFDLSRNGNNGTLTNGPTYNTASGGSIVFDGTNDYVGVAGSTTTSTATFICWLKRNGSLPNYYVIMLSRSGSNVNGINFFGSNQLGYHWNDNGNTYNWNSGLIIPDLSWCMCAVSVSTSFAVAHLCQSSGVTTSTNNVSHTTTTINALEVGRDSVLGRPFKGEIAQALLYNRALSQSEILQNFNATRKRFGL